MKTVYVAIQSNKSYNINWETFKLDKPNDQLVIICDADSATLLEHAIALKKVSHVILASDFSFEALKQKFETSIISLMDEGDALKITAIREHDVLTAAKLRESLGTDGSYTTAVEPFRDKAKMKAILDAKSMRIPLYEVFDPASYQAGTAAYIESLESKLPYPMFAKPTDGLGSSETCYIKDRVALQAWCEKHKESKNTVYEIDEFIEGTLYHCDSLVLGGRVLRTFVSEYLYPNADAVNGKPLASMTRAEDEKTKKLRAFAEASLEAFPEVPDGLTHLEIFEKKSGELIFLEVGARPPGGTVPEMYQKRYGVDIRALHHQLGFGIDVTAELELIDTHNGPYAGMCVMINPKSGGLVTKLNPPPFKESEHSIQWLCEAGNVLKPADHNCDITGMLYFWHESAEELRQDMERLEEYSAVTVTPLAISKIEKTDTRHDQSLQARNTEARSEVSKPTLLKSAEMSQLGGAMSFWGTSRKSTQSEPPAEPVNMATPSN